MWCCIRHFDLRIVNDCNVVDSEATAMHGEPAASTVAVAAVRPPRTPASRLLLACIKDPITLSDVGKHITSLQGATQAEERIKLLQSLASMQLCEVREGRRLPGADMRSVSFHRFPLSPTLRATLQHLDVPESFWPVPQSCPTAPRDQALPSQTPTAAPPPMRGAGKRARPPDAAAEDAKKGRGRPSAKEVDDLYSLQATLPCKEDYFQRTVPEAWKSLAHFFDRRAHSADQVAIRPICAWLQSSPLVFFVWYLQEPTRLDSKAMCVYQRDDKQNTAKVDPNCFAWGFPSRPLLEPF